MSFDFEGFSKGTGAAFNLALKGIPALLSNENIKEYFESAIQLIRSNFEVDNRRRVLISLCKTLNDHDYLNEFITRNYFLQLPFHDDEINEQLFDILYIIASSSPQSINNEITQKFKSLIPVSVRKSLAILTIYAKNFEIVKKSNWQAFLDILINPEFSDYFKARLYIKDYVSLLFFLCDKFPQYRIERLTECWNSICSCLVVKRDESVCLCYYVLIRLFDKGYIKSACQFPINAVTCHLRRCQVQDAVISLLLRMHPKGDEEGLADLINSLVYCARTQVNANLVLVQMAHDENIARQLVRDSTWMVLDLPTKVDTIRLFAVVIGHQTLRDELSKKNETLTFLRSICELNTPGILSIFTTFVRRLPLDQQYIQLCSDYGLISSFFLYALQRSDDSSIHSSLLFIDTIARVSYVHDLINACDYVNRIITSGNGRNFTSAMRVACYLAQYPKCAARFQKLGLEDWFIRNQKTNEIRKGACHFIKAVKKAYQEAQLLEMTPKPSENKNVESKIRRNDPSEQKELKQIQPIARNILNEQQHHDISSDDEKEEVDDHHSSNIEKEYDDDLHSSNDQIPEAENENQIPFEVAIEEEESDSSESGQSALPIQHIDTHHSEEEHQISVSHSGYEYDNTEIEENISESTEIVNNNASPTHGISSSSDEESA